MQLICTHEQADFDAVASLWAAKLLNPEAVPVLPRRLNRNVRGYLTLYGEHYAFMKISELKAGKLNALIMVDTQKVASIKGLSSETQVSILDHHPLEPNLDPGWTVGVEQIGATATLLTEALRGAGEELDGPTATLFLLGIYEDTGSLSYPGTTARDVSACAWLLDQGASLLIANDFLHQPLSLEQQDLYMQLLKGAKVHEIQGLEVVIALGDAAGTADEVSTLAHKLGDVFDAAALFLIVTLNGGVQLVARSYSESLDVARVAEQFGGGGHARAAAALVSESTIDDVRQRLLDLLEDFTVPTTTVAEIMSRGPQMLAPTSTVGEADAKMKRYGHEGYPVTDRGQVVGLLTRRAVDRAIGHGMQSRPISEVMDAGSLVVYPDDSVRHLQRVMIDHNWGQVPVSDRNTGEVVGIVTRTDLLNSLGGKQNSAVDEDYVAKLENALPPNRLSLLRAIAAESADSGEALYVVGGFVRDLVLGAPSIDFDFVVEGDAIRLASILAERYGGEISSHRRFRTAKWQLDHKGTSFLEAVNQDVGDLPRTIDFVSARTEFYSHPTALPSVTEGSIKLDLHRRDFSINTLALRLDGQHYGQLLDPWGGGRDLQEGQIRVLHSLSFVDDPTRMLRAVRLEQRLGFAIERRTLELMVQASPLIENVSGERIRSELAAILNEPDSGNILARIKELGLLSAIHPALTWDAWIAAGLGSLEEFEAPSNWKLKDLPDNEILFYALWTYRLSRDEAEEVGQRLHLGQSEANLVTRAGRQPCDLSANLRPSEWVDCFETQPEGALVATWIALDRREDARAVIDKYLSNWRWIRPTVDGVALREMGLAPGPAYRDILAGLRNAKLDGVINTAAGEQRMLEALVEEIRQGD